MGRVIRGLGIAIQQAVSLMGGAWSNALPDSLVSLALGYRPEGDVRCRICRWEVQVLRVFLVREGLRILAGVPDSQRLKSLY